MRKTSHAVMFLLCVVVSVSVFAENVRDMNVESGRVLPQVFDQAPWLDEMGVLRSGGFCATRHYSGEEILIMETEHMDALMSGRVKIRTDALPAQIKVNFHIITDKSNGRVPASVLNNTITKLNEIFSGGEGGVNTGHSFVWNNAVNGQPIYYDNRSWYTAKPGSRGEAEMKQTIASKPENNTREVFNIYVNRPGTYMGGTLLGWATFPWELAANPLMDGVVMNNLALNNGGTTSYNSGDVVAHETGHWLGLYHTFQGGCTGSTGYDGTTGLGDLVADTAPEASNASGCPTGRDTCAGNGVDPIDNYMDYSSDSCQVRFTSGQNDRIILKSGLR
jgi:hypothetical protein